MELPISDDNIVVTYKKTFITGNYGTNVEKIIVTKMGFFSDGKFHIPPRWAYFKGVLLPDGFGGDHLNESSVISWEYCN